jgi:hypothetical protein
MSQQHFVVVCECAYRDVVIKVLVLYTTNFDQGGLKEVEEKKRVR